MTGETIRDLLEPVIGKSGAIYLAVSNIGRAAADCPADHAVPGTGRALAALTVAGHHSRCARSGRGIALVPCRCPVVSPRRLARRN
jgi:hypothetical protein